MIAENRKEWDLEVLQDICNERDCELIKQIPIPVSDKEDSRFWLFDEKGNFTVKSCYRRLRGETECPDKVFWKKLWGLNLPGKVINFFWRTCRQVLPTADALRKKIVDINPNCSWCQRNVEIDLHVLFGCCFAKEVWARVGLADVVQVALNDSVLTLLKRAFQTGTREQNDMVDLVCWNLWHRRNNWVWNCINTSSFGVQSRSSSMLVEWNRAREELATSTRQQQGSCRRWSKPPEGWVKINTDAACNLRTGQMRVGCVIRDDQGQFIRACSKVFQGRL